MSVESIDRSALYEINDLNKIEKQHIIGNFYIIVKNECTILYTGSNFSLLYEYKDIIIDPNNFKLKDYHIKFDNIKEAYYFTSMVDVGDNVITNIDNEPYIYKEGRFRKINISI